LPQAYAATAGTAFTINHLFIIERLAARSAV